MTYSPGLSEVSPPMVSPYTFGWSVAAHERTISSDASSATYGSANLAVYEPVLVPVTCVARRLWWANGATVSASYNVDVAIYADSGFKPGARLVSSGSTAQGTALQVQFVDVTDTTLAPGLYWLAITCSSTSATLMQNTFATQVIDGPLVFQQSSALPLPSTATPVEATSSAAIYLFGFATTASP